MSTRPVRQRDVSRALAEHALRRRVEDQKFLVPARHNHGISHVGQDRLKNFVSLREVACKAMPVHDLVLNCRETHHPASDLSRVDYSNKPGSPESSSK